MGKMDTIAEKFYGKKSYWQPRTKPIKVKILEKSEHLLKMKVEGEKHTLFSPLRKELSNDDEVEFVAYRVEHPLFDRIIFEVKTKTKDPFEVIKQGITRMKEKIGEMREAFRNAFRKGQTNPVFIEEKKWQEYLSENKPPREG